MKITTCKRMGGSCDTVIPGNDPEEMMKNGEAHVREMAAKGDEEHQKILAMMEEMGKNPEESKAWMDKFMADFPTLPEE